MYHLSKKNIKPKDLQHNSTSTRRSTSNKGMKSCQISDGQSEALNRRTGKTIAKRKWWTKNTINNDPQTRHRPPTT